MQSSQYAARAFHDSLDGGRVSGVVQLTAAGLRFDAGARALTLPLQGLQLMRGGSNDRLLVLTHPQHPGWALYTDDLRLLRDPALLQAPALRAQAAGLQRRRWSGMAVTGIIAALLLAIPLVLLLKIDVLAGLAARQVPASWEEKLGRSVFAQLRLQTDLLEAPALGEALLPLTQPLVASLEPSPRHAFRFHVARDARINAFALPGGDIVLHSELILRAQSAEELLGVLAHEMAHVSEQHGLRSVIASAGILVIAQTVLGDVTGLLATAASAAPLLLNQRYSRGFEHQADREAVALLRRAEINPDGLLRFFETMQQEEKKARDKLRDTTGERTAEALETVGGFLSTHPATSERMAEIRRLSAHQGGPYRDLNPQFRALQAELKRQLATQTPRETANGSAH